MCIRDSINAEYGDDCQLAMSANFDEQQRRTQQLMCEADQLLLEVNHRQLTGSPYMHKKRLPAADCKVEVPMLWKVASGYEEEQKASDGYRHTPYAHDKWDQDGNRRIQSRHKHSQGIRCVQFGGPRGQHMSSHFCRYSRDEWMPDGLKESSAPVRGAPELPQLGLRR
eukprot:TRINITY_DN6374_c0_g1_i2.p1 TRINITY_DN6374_c0_g1~~TRINITY_DN6374_c0_g1_i2.p1  ORF type:complete len:168 (+),score=39.45 TRINITY_DN6374_c0_g1_i2:151-654(+)